VLGYEPQRTGQNSKKPAILGVEDFIRQTGVIHLSNATANHPPAFGHPEGELPLGGLVYDLPLLYDWHGTVILEYLWEYRNQLVADHDGLKR